MKKLTRDETEHGQHYYLASEVEQALAQPVQEPVAHTVIAGALFDFMGWLTSRKERIVLSSADEASPAVDAIRDFATKRGLSLDDAQVREWIEALAQPPLPAQPVQEPAGSVVRWVDGSLIHGWFGDPPPEGTLLYATPPQRPWVGLTDDEIKEIHNESRGKDVGVATGLTERKLKEKNT